MLFYSKESALLVYDQVNRDNPDLVVKLTPAIAALTSGPTSVTLNQRNTKAVFTGYPGTGVQGNVTVYYDRINLATLFNFVPTVAIKDTVLTVRDALPAINDALGLTLVASDLQSPDASLPKPSVSPQTLKLNISGNCPAFTGSLTIRYTVPSGAIYPDSDLALKRCCKVTLSRVISEQPELQSCLHTLNFLMPLYRPVRYHRYILVPKVGTSSFTRVGLFTFRSVLSLAPSPGIRYIQTDSFTEQTIMVNTLRRRPLTRDASLALQAQTTKGFTSAFVYLVPGKTHTSAAPQLPLS